MCGSLQLPEAPSWEEEAVRSRGTSWGGAGPKRRARHKHGLHLGLEGSPPPHVPPPLPSLKRKTSCDLER